MPEFEVICLANSRKRSGRCIAGLRTDGQGWLRPVGWTKDGGLTPNNYWLDDNSEPQLLDVIRFQCARPHPKPHHPEDWILAPATWRLMRRPASADALALLRDGLTPGPELFGDTRNRIPAARFSLRSAASSLALIAPENLRWLVGESNGRRNATAQFSLCGAAYALRLTDPVYEQRLERLAPGAHPRKAAGISENETVWLTVSTSEPFQKEPGAEAFCHKLVAAVIVLPERASSESPPTAPEPDMEIPPFPVPILDAIAELTGNAAPQIIYERGDETWSEREDERLMAMAKSGMTSETIAKLLQRSENAVLGRVGKLVLEKYRCLL